LRAQKAKAFIFYDTQTIVSFSFEDQTFRFPNFCWTPSLPKQKVKVGYRNEIKQQFIFNCTTIFQVGLVSRTYIAVEPLKQPRRALGVRSNTG